MQPRILARSQHTLSRKQIDPDPLRVLYRLRSSGFKAFLVGGGVRDLLLGRRPKDFDIGTDASPQQVKKLFRNCFIIGRRFRLCHVRFGNKVVEVATFRRKAEPEEGDTIVKRDNTFGTPEEDAFRRDFTINALFYDIADFSIIDYTGGIADLEAKRVRVIGDPDERFREDPVRMMRAVAIACRLGFRIDREAQEAIRARRGEIVKSSHVRILDEIYKILRQGSARSTFEQLYATGLLAYIFPEAHKALSRGETGLLDTLGTLDDYRKRVGSDAALSNAILIAHLLPPLGIPLSSGLRATARPRPFVDVDGPRDFQEEIEEPLPAEALEGQVDETDVVAEMVELDEEADLGHGPGVAHGVTPISLPFARRDIERLGLLAAVGSKLHRTDLPRNTARNLAHKPYFQEALLLAEIHGLDSEIVQHWRDVAAGATVDGESVEAEVVPGMEPPRPHPPRSIDGQRRPPRRRGRRRPGRPRGPAA
ncbi:MAG: polynucleotide adenylyltransferase PcnB [Vicinamibacteria bacterium]|nr:polynucleotide adenylyltransferase PcnB [Vicinamibacteria bacterium]